MENPVPNANLLTLQMFGNGEEGWAGGYVSDTNNNRKPVLLHYKDGRWQQDSSITGDGAVRSAPCRARAAGAGPAAHACSASNPGTRPDSAQAIDEDRRSASTRRFPDLLRNHRL